MADAKEAERQEKLAKKEAERLEKEARKEAEKREKEAKREEERQRKLAEKEQERLKKLGEKEQERLRKQQEREEKRRSELEKKLRNSSNARRAKAEKALANRTEKLARKKAEAAVARAALRGTLRNRVLAAAREEIANLNDKYVHIPEKGAAESRFNKYVNAAKRKYYKNTKKINPAQMAMRQRLLNEGINEKYIKFGPRFKNYNAVLAAARKRANKNGSKTQKGQRREQILAFAQDTLGLDEKAVRSAICVKQKK